MKYEQHFKEHYEEWLKGFSVKSLVKHEQILSELIDGKLALDSLLCDEILMLYELVRNECVARVYKLAETENISL